MQGTLDTLWVMIAGFLVFFMNTGFGMLESGLAQSKNAVNIMSKNFVVFSVAVIVYYLVGWGLMFGSGSSFVGTEGVWALSGSYPSMDWANVPLLAKFFFQAMFAVTAATIVSGAVAERIKFISFIVFSVLITALIYPVIGHWIWGGGFLADWGFHDFAGSTVVHSVGGWCALTGAWLLGPRHGKYLENGRIHPIPGHNMTSAFIGCFILWLGWFGFNPGSLMAANAEAIAHIALTTTFAAAAGTLSSTLVAWFTLKKPDITMTLNGCLAGLVAITAPCAVVTLPAALLIGAIAGGLVVAGILFFDKLKIDDPVGATSVHLVNGIWGTLAVGIFADAHVAKTIAGIDVPAFLPQLWGVLIVGVYCFGVSLVLWLILKRTLGIRVGDDEEWEGLDATEHGNVAYPDFQASTR